MSFALTTPVTVFASRTPRTVVRPRPLGFLAIVIAVALMGLTTIGLGLAYPTAANNIAELVAGL